MRWFDEQIRQRKAQEDRILSESLYEIAGAISGKNKIFDIKDKRKLTAHAVDEILSFYHLRGRDVPKSITETEDQLEYLLRPHGIMRRHIQLKKGWHKDAAAPMLATRVDTGTAVALIPRRGSGYLFQDAVSGKTCRVTQQNESLFDCNAICFYKPFPQKRLDGKELTRYILKTVPKRDFIFFAFVALAAILIGMAVPAIYNLLLKTAEYQTDLPPVAATAVFLITLTVGAGLFSSAKQLACSKIRNEMTLSVEAAAMMRILSLPLTFFRKHSAGELANRVQSISTLCLTIADIIICMGLSALFSMLFLVQIYVYAPSLLGISLCIMVLQLVFSMLCGKLHTKAKRKQIHYSDKEHGISYALISGIHKIKLAAAEKRAFAKWATAYSKTAKATYDPPFILKIKIVISAFITIAGGVGIYILAMKHRMEVADYFAFNCAYAIASAAFFNFTVIMSAVADARSQIENIGLFFEAAPEISPEKEILAQISGDIELSHVSFRYCDDMPNVIDDLSLKIKPGQYVALVGKTGCGKSTLMRLMLGFEKPQKGSVYFDNNSIDKIDLKSLRQKIGVVMQDGKLFQGDILSNITIAAPNMTVEDAWHAAELAGIAEDIKNMPMGMHTMISEGGGGISGGQKQRLLIARAIASKPKILLFDEATSALDNVTQKHVADSLAELDCTRIVIAHRLSTIKHCDRIIVLDGGRIAEDGTYDELMQKNGLFAALVARQTLE